MKRSSRATNAARCGLLAGVVAWALAALTLVRGGLDALAAVHGGAADLDAALGGLAAVLGLGLLAWTALATACALVAAALPAGSAAAARAHRVGERITPVAMRRVLAVAVGATLAVGALPAQAAGPGGSRAGTSPGSRIVATAAQFGPVAEQVLAGSDLDPGWGAPPTTPSRPAGQVQPALDPTWAPPGRLRPGIDPDAGAVVVRRGDTLWDLAARRLGPGATDAEIAQAWPLWFRANRAVIGDDPDVLRPGQRLTTPTSTRGGVA